jgi:hypothetical protein
MTEYRVLWVDDEHEEKGGGFKALADDYNITIDAVKSLDEFKVKLIAGYENYDGIITDARFFKTNNQTTGTENEEAIYELNIFILESIPKKFKLFVYTGQPDLVMNNQFNLVFRDVYEKSKDEERLLSDLKIAADKLPEMQIKKKYSRVFEIFNDHYLPKSSIKDLLKFLDDEIKHDKSSIKMARDFIEDLFKSFAKHDIIPSFFIDKGVKCSAISRFISGKEENNYKLDESSLPPKIITDMIEYLVKTTNPACHRSHIDDHINNVATDYLFDSVKYALLDVIIWFKLYIDKQPATKNWSKIESSSIVDSDYIKGKVIQLHPVKFIAFLQPYDKSMVNAYIPRSFVVENELQEGQIIDCTIGDSKLGGGKKDVTSIKQ